MDPKIIIFSTLIFSFSISISNSPVLAQITTPCSSTALSSVSPCLNYLGSSGGSGVSPTAACCSALKSLTGNGMDCLCLIVTAGIPLRIPVNRTLAISLPRACGMPGVPVQCKASPAAPLPAPGPVALGPTTSPTASPVPEVAPAPTEAPESDDTPLLTPPSPARDNGGGSRTVLTPSAAAAVCSWHPRNLSLLLFAFVFAILNYF